MFRNQTSVVEVSQYEAPKNEKRVSVLLLDGL